MQQINESLEAPAPFTVTPAALSRIGFLLSDEPAGTQFWVGVDGGGCSGFQYKFELKAGALASGDYLIESGDARIVVDEVSQPFLQGATLDYEEDLARAGFAVKNPNANARCGCGNSFSVAL